MFKSVLKIPNEIILRKSCQKCFNLRKSPFRTYSQDPGEQMRQANKKRLRSTLYYFTATGIVTLGMSYAAVPLYRIFCQAYSYGGTTVEGHDSSKVENMQADKSRPIRVRFNADKAANMRWNFKPQQTEITVFPGETALAFYTAKNPTDNSVVGISTYNVIPFEAGQYFNKIQCFCFEEQMLNPHEQVDMPVFFYIDPEFAEDPYLENCTEITLSYTFFEAKDGFKIPVPQYTK
ncbi:cytochrome c oxidase assembly protein COX11, mitochondrial [Euwallacea fornicatus]|uniref:cytochrome c oxidase assembly protein COX11, mitochondrial n=1 Tax=Euwallacea fornicatus TaxID=995702 RepID=UPI00339006AB